MDGIWNGEEGMVVAEQRIKKLECFCRLTSLGPKLAWGRKRRNHRGCLPTHDKCVSRARGVAKKMRGADLLMLRDNPGWVLQFRGARERVRLWSFAFYCSASSKLQAKHWKQD